MTTTSRERFWKSDELSVPGDPASANIPRGDAFERMRTNGREEIYSLGRSLYDAGDESAFLALVAEIIERPIAETGEEAVFLRETCRIAAHRLKTYRDTNVAYVLEYFGSRDAMWSVTG